MKSNFNRFKDGAERENEEVKEKINDFLR